MTSKQLENLVKIGQLKVEPPAYEGDLDVTEALVMSLIEATEELRQVFTS